MKKISIGLTLLAALAAFSCRSLEVAPPNAITDNQIKELLASGDEQKVQEILTAIGVTPAYFNYYGTYTGYSSYPQNYQFDQEFIFNMCGNDAILGSPESSLTSGHITYYNLTSDVWRQKDATGPFWNMPVDFYIAANKTLSFITPEVVESNPALGKQRAQALVVRAWGYLNLIERFAPAFAQNSSASGLPIYTEYKINPVAEISSAKVVYDNIITWLKEAISLLKGSYVNVSYTDDVEDIDLGVAQYLLMRAALQYTDYSTVISAGEELTKRYTSFIPEANYGASTVDLDDYVAGTKELNAKDNAFFYADANPEVILAAKYGGLYNKQLCWTLCNTFAAGEAGVGKAAPRIDDRLLSRIASNDFRKNAFTDHDVEYTYVTNSDGVLNKVKLPKQSTLKWAATQALTETQRTEKSYSDDILIRSSEVYLMLAEAYNASNNPSAAKTTLNKLLAARTVAGATPLTCDNYGESDLTKLIQLQWRIEMWMEKGLEWHNNRRWGIDVNRDGSSTHYSQTKSLPTSKMTLEVPKDEQTANTNWASIK